MLCPSVPSSSRRRLSFLSVRPVRPFVRRRPSHQRVLASTLANVKAEAESFGPEHAKATQACSDQALTLQAFESGAIACFEAMQNRTNSPAIELTAAPADARTTEIYASKVIDEAPDVTSAPRLSVGGQ